MLDPPPSSCDFSKIDFEWKIVILYHFLIFSVLINVVLSFPARLATEVHTLLLPYNGPIMDGIILSPLALEHYVYYEGPYHPVLELALKIRNQVCP